MNPTPLYSPPKFPRFFLSRIEGETMKKILVNDGLREFLDPKDCFVKQVFPKLEFEEK